MINSLKMNVAICQQRAERLESKYRYVHHVYSCQALSFNDLCDGPWPEIETFLLSLPRRSLVADVGKVILVYVSDNLM